MLNSACCVASSARSRSRRIPARHGEEPIRDPGGKVGVGRLVTSLGSDHEIGIHCLIRTGGIGSDRCITQRTGIRRDQTFNIQVDERERRRPPMATAPTSCSGFWRELNRFDHRLLCGEVLG